MWLTEKLSHGAGDLTSQWCRLVLSAHCYKWARILIRPGMLSRCKTPTNNNNECFPAGSLFPQLLNIVIRQLYKSALNWYFFCMWSFVHPLSYIKQDIQQRYPCCQDSTSSTLLPLPFQLPVSFPPLNVLSLKIPTEGGQSAFQHLATSWRPCIWHR